MNMIKFLLAAICWGFILTFSSCGKYEEGPGFSLVSKEIRLEELWKLEKYMHDGVDKTDSAFHYLGYNYHLRFSDVNDGDYTDYAQECEGCTDQLSWTGKWRFENDKEDVVLEPNGYVQSERRYRILRLTKDDLFMEFTNKNGVLERLEFSNVLEQAEIDDKHDGKDHDKGGFNWE
jgi:hypothetical protein